MYSKGVCSHNDSSNDITAVVEWTSVYDTCKQYGKEINYDSVCGQSNYNLTNLSSISSIKPAVSTPENFI